MELFQDVIHCTHVTLYLLHWCRAVSLMHIVRAAFRYKACLSSTRCCAPHILMCCCNCVAQVKKSMAMIQVVLGERHAEKQAALAAAAEKAQGETATTPAPVRKIDV